jgi:hypothetical protein
MSNEQRGQIDRKGKGKAKDQNQTADDLSEDRQKQGEGEDQRNDRDGGQQQMKEIRRPPPLPAVKGTIGAIGPSSPISYFLLEDLADRQNHLQEDHSSPDHQLLP